MLDWIKVANHMSRTLETSAFGLYDFDIMPDLIKYEQITSGDLQGVAIVDDNDNPIIIRQYNEPALKYILSAVAQEIVEGIQLSGTLEDLSDVTYHNIQNYSDLKNQVIINTGQYWTNYPVSALGISGTS